MDTTQASDPVCFPSMPQALPWGGGTHIPRMVSVADQTLSSKHSPPPLLNAEKHAARWELVPRLLE